MQFQHCDVLLIQTKIYHSKWLYKWVINNGLMRVILNAYGT